jgi:hypothetical protein
MNPVILILGNLCSVFAMITDSISATRKTPKAVLLVQSISQAFYGIGTLLLKGYSGAVQNMVSILRNFAAIKNIQSKWIQWLFVVLGVILGLLFNNIGILGYLPILANLQYSLAVFHFRDNERALKYSLSISVVLYTFFSAAILNFIGVAINLVILVTTLIHLIKTRKK